MFFNAAKVRRHHCTCCAGMAVLFVLVGCSSGDGDSGTSGPIADPQIQQPQQPQTPIQNDPGAAPGTPVVVAGVNGLPAADGEAPFIVEPMEFTLDEDTLLTGSLAVVPTGAVSVGLLRSPSHGSISLLPDGQFVYTPQRHFYGDDAFDVYAWQGDVGSVPTTIKLRIQPVPDAPTLAADVIPVVEQDTDYRVQFLAQDADSDPLVFSATNLPEWLEIDGVSGLLSGHPLQTDVGIHRGLVVAVADGTGLSASLGPFSVEVIDINDSPTINPSQFPSRLDARESVTVSVFPDDPDGDRVKVSTELNDFVDVVVRGGMLDVTAKDVVEVTPINLVVIAEDRLGSVSREIIPITIYPLTNSGRGRTLVGRKYGAGVHLVVLGDGYKQDELEEYELDVWRLVALMRSDPAVRTHFGGWNVHSLPVASVDSGIDDNTLEDFRDTEYNAGFYCSGIPRLICADEA
ncbi:MAG: hypothetical protein KTR33_00370, partial [Gammaproteobacteria bacterium]|nr:hypothetical protein [Gammaproteobacteria bacterium]